MGDKRQTTPPKGSMKQKPKWGWLDRPITLWVLSFVFITVAGAFAAQYVTRSNQCIMTSQSILVEAQTLFKEINARHIAIARLSIFDPSPQSRVAAIIEVLRGEKDVQDVMFKGRTLGNIADRFNMLMSRVVIAPDVSGAILSKVIAEWKEDQKTNGLSGDIKEQEISKNVKNGITLYSPRYLDSMTVDFHTHFNFIVDQLNQLSSDLKTEGPEVNYYLRLFSETEPQPLCSASGVVRMIATGLEPNAIVMLRSKP